MEQQEKREPGRPKGRDFPIPKVIQFTREQAAELRRLADENCGGNQSEYVRRAIEKAAREGL